MFYIRFFGKRQIILDDKNIYNKKKFTDNFSISFPVEFYNITICQKEKYFILKINDISFNKILNDQKLRKFNILEDNYKMEKEEKRKRKLQKRKNKILLNTLKKLIKEEKKNNIIDLNREKEEEDESKTIYQSFEINENNFDELNKYNKNNKFDDSKTERKNKKNFMMKEKKDYISNKKVESSFNTMINYDLFGNDSHISGDLGSTDIYRYNFDSSSKSNKNILKNG